jgi:hypothetical protein
MIGHQTKRLGPSNWQLLFNARPATSTTSSRVLLIQPTHLATHRRPVETLCFHPIQGAETDSQEEEMGHSRGLRTKTFLFIWFKGSQNLGSTISDIKWRQRRLPESMTTTKRPNKKKKKREKNSWRTGPARNRAHLNSHQIRRHVPCSDWQTGRSS